MIRSRATLTGANRRSGLKQAATARDRETVRSAPAVKAPRKNARRFIVFILGFRSLCASLVILFNSDAEKRCDDARSGEERSAKRAGDFRFAAASSPMRDGNFERPQ